MEDVTVNHFHGLWNQRNKPKKCSAFKSRHLHSVKDFDFKSNLHRPTDHRVFFCREQPPHPPPPKKQKNKTGKIEMNSTIPQ